MVARDGHPVREIKPMGIKALNAGVEVELVAACFSRPGDDPIEEGASKTLRAAFGIGDQVVHVANPGPGQKFEEPIACERANLSSGFEIGEPIALLLLAFDALDELRFVEMGTKLRHDRKTAKDRSVGFRVSDERVH